jgi:hypothetical protein
MEWIDCRVDARARARREGRSAGCDALTCLAECGGARARRAASPAVDRIGRQLRADGAASDLPVRACARAAHARTGRGARVAALSAVRGVAGFVDAGAAALREPHSTRRLARAVRAREPGDANVTTGTAIAGIARRIAAGPGTGHFVRRAGRGRREATLAGDALVPHRAVGITGAPRRGGRASAGKPREKCDRADQRDGCEAKATYSHAW